ncbi:MAG: FAD-dependent oxidoreductase [bacterium]
MIGIIGGGITGLSLAKILQRNHIQSIVFESDNIGGKIRTIYRSYKGKDYFIELGPDSIVFEESKISQIHQFLPGLFENKNFIKLNRVYVLLDDRIGLFPNSWFEFIQTSLIPTNQKLKLVYRLLFNLFKSDQSGKDLDCTLDEYCYRRFDRVFCDRIIFPLFETVFGIPCSRLVTKFVYPYLSKFRAGVYKPTKMFNHPKGLNFLVENFLSKGLQILKERITSVRHLEDGFLLNEKYKVDKLVFTGDAMSIRSLVNSISTNSSELSNLLSSFYERLSKISYHSAFIDIFVLNNLISFKASGIIFKTSLYPNLKSITFFSKKWYSNYEVEILRIFSDGCGFEKILNQLSDFFGRLGYEFEGNIVDHIRIDWVNSLLDYDRFYFNVLEDLKVIARKLQNWKIYILGSFLEGTSIVDRIIASIKFYKLLTSK